MSVCKILMARLVGVRMALCKASDHPSTRSSLVLWGNKGDKSPPNVLQHTVQHSPKHSTEGSVHAVLRGGVVYKRCFWTRFFPERPGFRGPCPGKSPKRTTLSWLEMLTFQRMANVDNFSICILATRGIYPLIWAGHNVASSPACNVHSYRSTTVSHKSKSCSKCLMYASPFLCVKVFEARRCCSSSDRGFHSSAGGCSLAEKPQDWAW